MCSVGCSNYNGLPFYFFAHIAERRIAKIKSIHYFTVPFRAHHITLPFKLHRFIYRGNRNYFFRAMLKSRTDGRSGAKYVNDDYDAVIVLVNGIEIRRKAGIQGKLVRFGFAHSLSLERECLWLYENNKSV